MVATDVLGNTCMQLCGITPVVIRFFWPPDTPLTIWSPTKVSAHTCTLTTGDLVHMRWQWQGRQGPPFLQQDTHSALTTAQ